ncbi:MAG: DUF2716 domain-containing protein [Oscillospiraceae bacterium]|nr:DUF2716 domain-containing protein [Oscillospiraceae bacterium]
MSGQKELWIILHDEEYNTIWDKFQEEFQFQPQYGQYAKPTFIFNVPVDVYDIKDSPIYNDDEDLNDIIRNGFILAMDDDDFMYAFDYNHTSYRYNPRIKTVIEYPVWISMVITTTTTNQKREEFPMVEQLIAIFCDIDEFCVEYERYLEEHLLTERVTKRRKQQWK